MNFFRRQWFLLSLLSVFALSALLPSLPEGDWQRTTKLTLVFLIFFFSGISIQTGDLIKGVFHLRLHLFIQILNLAVLPLVMISVVQLIKPLELPKDFVLGLLILGALPTTVTSCVAFTTLAGGNVVGSLVNASLGNLLGVLITPLWLLLFTKGTPFQLELLPVLQKLSLTVFLPLFMGQVVQYVAQNRLNKKRRKAIGLGGQSLVLGILYVSMQKAYAQGAAFPVILLLHGAWIVGVYHLIALALPWFLSPVFQLNMEDRICSLFCASQKTLALGIPLISICFPDHPGLPLLALGILLYHPIQLLVSSYLTSHFRHAYAEEEGNTLLN